MKFQFLQLMICKLFHQTLLNFTQLLLFVLINISVNNLNNSKAEPNICTWSSWSNTSNNVCLRFEDACVIHETRQCLCSSSDIVHPSLCGNVDNITKPISSLNCPGNSDCNYKIQGTFASQWDSWSPWTVDNCPASRYREKRCDGTFQYPGNAYCSSSLMEQQSSDNNCANSHTDNSKLTSLIVVPLCSFLMLLILVVIIVVRTRVRHVRRQNSQRNSVSTISTLGNRVSNIYELNGVSTAELALPPVYEDVIHESSGEDYKPPSYEQVIHSLPSYTESNENGF